MYLIIMKTPRDKQIINHIYCFGNFSCALKFKKHTSKITNASICYLSKLSFYKNNYTDCRVE